MSQSLRYDETEGGENVKFEGLVKIHFISLSVF